MFDKDILAKHFDAVAPRRTTYFQKNRLYHQQVIDACHPFMNPDTRALELGCSVGDLLHDLHPSFGVGVDISPVSIAAARQQYPSLQWICADVEDLPTEPPLEKQFDLIIMSDLFSYLDDIQQVLENVRRLCHPGTRLFISTWNWMWQPLLRVGEMLRLKAPDLHLRQNWISPTAIQIFLKLAGYETLQVLPGLLLPYHVPGLSPFVNLFSQAPLLRRMTLLTTIVARPLDLTEPVNHTSVTVVIPTRNEVGNIETLVQEVPDMGTHTELLFVDGNSTDGTIERIYEQIQAHPERDVKLMSQVPPQSPDVDTPPNLMLKLGKGDAVRKGFDAAGGNIVMILDSDVSVKPRDLPKFYSALVTGKARLANGTRFVYPQAHGAMRPLNRLGNVGFSLLFSWLLDQPITDTLCGTKALYKTDYEAIAANRHVFGDFDPFGDFDLLFGAAWLRYAILDVPIHYQARTYGDSKVRVGMHGLLLGKMSLIAFWRFKIRGPLTRRRPPKASAESSLNKPRVSLMSWVVMGFVIMLFWLLEYARSRKSSG